MTYCTFILPQAADELEYEIAYSQRTWGTAHARAYKKEVLERVEMIARNPILYAENQEFGEGIRSVRHKGNRIIYMIDEPKKRVIILGFPSIYTSSQL